MHETDNDITKQIRDGSYFLQARAWYSELFHAPIAERSYFIIVILLAIVNFYFAVESFIGLFPIRPTIPFYVYSNDILEDMPRIVPINASKSRDKNVAVMEYMLKSYVINRESYDLGLYEIRYRNIWSESTQDVFDHFASEMDASNPYSPYQQYSNRFKKTVTPISIDFIRDKVKSQAHIVYETSVVSLVDNQEVNHSRWQADITYKYTDFYVDQSLDHPVWVARFLGLTGDTLKVSGEKRKVVPMTFLVTDYHIKELLE